MQHFAFRLWRHSLTQPMVLGAVSLLMVFSLVQQYQQWHTLLVDQPKSSPASIEPDQAAVDLEQLGRLFGVPAQKVKEPPRKTILPLILLGSFVNTRPEHSAAVIQVSGEAPRRVTVNQEVVRGVRLEAVFADHVVLLRGRSPEQLFFPRATERRGASAHAGQSANYAAFKSAQLGKLPAATTDKRAKQKAEMLLQDLKRQREAGYN